MTAVEKDLGRTHVDTLWTPFLQMQQVRDKGPLIFDRAEGVHLYDSTGKQYLDAHAALWLANVGFGRKEVIEAAYEQMKKMAFFSMFMGYSNVPAIRLGERLMELTGPEGMHKVFFSNSGSEAVETALKMARGYWKNLGKGNRYKVIARKMAYHGVTLGAVSATGIPANRKPFEPLVPGFRHIPEPNCYRNAFGAGLTEEEVSIAASAVLRWQIEMEGPDTVAAFIAEPVQGAGGVIIPPEDYLRRCKAVCEEYGVLFIADEVITGFGRTGTWFGSRTYGIKPDIMCFAKGITSGYIPMGATVCREEIYDAYLGTTADREFFRHGNTYAGHATAAAAALANLKLIEDEDLPGNAKRVGAHFLQGLRGLEKYPIVGDVRGIGLLARVELVQDKKTKKQFSPLGSVGARVQKRVQDLGVIFRNVMDTLAFSPPLILTTAQADQIVAALDIALGEVCESL